MNYQALFTPEGFKTFLSEYHKHLNAKLGFPSLTGMKPMHRAAEVLSLPGGEALFASLGKLKCPQQYPLVLLELESWAKPLRDGWLALDRGQTHAEAAKFASKHQAKHPNSLVPAMLLAESLRAMREKTAAAALYGAIVQRAESMQGFEFSWSQAGLSEDSDEAWCLELAMIALAGLAVEDGRWGVASMHLQRVQRLSVSVSNQSSRQSLLHSWVVGQIAILRQEAETTTFDSRMALGQQWAMAVRQMVRSFNGEVSAPLPPLPREEGPLFELRLEDLAELSKQPTTTMSEHVAVSTSPWKKRAAPFIASLEKAVRHLAKQGRLVDTPSAYREYFQLDAFVGLSMNGDLPPGIRSELSAVLESIGYRFPSAEDGSSTQKSSVTDQFGYLCIEHPHHP